MVGVGNNLRAVGAAGETIDDRKTDEIHWWFQSLSGRNLSSEPSEIPIWSFSEIYHIVSGRIDNVNELRQKSRAVGGDLSESNV
jgi:hypothetical protein